MKSRAAYNEYMREYMLARYRRRRAVAIETLGGRCTRCGSLEELEFDHVDPTTRGFVLAKGGSYSEKRWQVELKKCQLLCRECHSHKTIVEDLAHEVGRGRHGTAAAYMYCRCDACRAAKAEQNRGYRANKKNGVVAQ